MSKNEPNSLEWRPVNEVCGTDAYTSIWYAMSKKINSRTRNFWKEEAKHYAGYKLDSYENRRIYEDGIGQIKIGARLSEAKDGEDVLDVAKVLLRTGEPVKMKSAFEILEWFIKGVCDDEF